MFLPQQMQQGRPPMFFGQDPNMQAQMAQPQQMQPPPPVTPQSNPILEALKARQMADAMAGTSQQINAIDPWTAGAKALAGGLEGWMEGRAKEKELANQQAADKEITDALASDDPLKALSKLNWPEARAAYRQLRLDEVTRERQNPIDVDGDGRVDFYESSKTGERKAAPMSAAEQEAAQIRLYQQTTGREQALNRAQAERMAKAKAGNVDPNTGVRVAPAGVQGRDYAELAKIRQSADAAASIAATLTGVAPALDSMRTGPGNAAGRAFMGVASLIPGLESANDFVKNYDAIEQASKTIGIDTLQKVGGSDTERELLTAIQTTVNNDVLPEENMRRFNDQIVAADILAKKAQFATEWVNKVGSLQYTAPNGMSWPQFWSEYQKSAWADHRRATQGKGSVAAKGRPTGQPSQSGPALPPGFKVIQ